MKKDFINFRNRLKYIPRTGWLELGVPKEYVESVYAHLGATKDLIHEYNKRYNLNLNIEKINEMITIKELIKAYTKEEKSVIMGNSSKETNRNIIIDIKNKFDLDDSFVDLYDEYESGKTKEAEYALLFSKFESDLQVVDYYEKGFITLEAVKKDIEYYPEELKKEVKALLDKYPIPPLAWLTYDSKYYIGNELFTNLSNKLIVDCIKNYNKGENYENNNKFSIK